MKQREIKFRAWTGKIITKNIVIHKGKACKVQYGDIIGLKDSVLMQYTGLKDKNGKEIYEGDIIMNNHPITDKMKCTGNFTIDLTNPVTVTFKDQMFKAGNLSLCSYRNPEIIGSIYENPELLNNQ